MKHDLGDILIIDTHPYSLADILICIYGHQHGNVTHVFQNQTTSSRFYFILGNTTSQANKVTLKFKDINMYLSES